MPMSVVKSKRGESDMEFVHTARELQIYTIKKCVGFPKRYTFYVSQPIANSATRIHQYTKMANSIYPTNPHEVQMRRDYLLKTNAELKITLNEKKTQIVKLTHGFTFLKARIYLTESGKVIKKIPKESVTRERRKLKKLLPLCEKGKITLEDVSQSRQSWRAYADNFDAHKSARGIERLFNRLFAKPQVNREPVYA